MALSQVLCSTKLQVQPLVQEVGQCFLPILVAVDLNKASYSVQKQCLLEPIAHILEM